MLGLRISISFTYCTNVKSIQVYNSELVQSACTYIDILCTVAFVGICDMLVSKATKRGFN